MNKLTKRLAAIGAAMTMAVSMMSMNASAATSGDWKVYYSPGAGGMNVSSKTFEFYNISKKIYGINSSCTKFVSGTNSNGESNRVRYWAYAINSNGQAGQGSNISNKYHTRVESKDRNLSNPMATNLTLIVKYQSELSLVYSDIKGSTYAYYSTR